MLNKGFRAAFFCLLMVSTTTAATSYQFVDLGSLTPPNQTYGSWGHAINNSGVVVGRSQTGPQTYNAFQWSAGTMKSLGADANSGISDAFGISNSGVIVGVNATITYIQGISYYYSPAYFSAGQVHALPVIADSDGIGYARAISSSGKYIAGDLQDTRGVGNAALWVNGALTTISGMRFGFGVNDSGEMVGSTQVDGGFAVAVSYSGGTVHTLFGGEAKAVNNAGQIVGWSFNHASQYGYPVLYENGVATKIGPESPQSQALAINNAGTVVGMYSPDYNVIHGFVYQNGLFTDLNDIASAGPGAVFESADAINDAGQITGRYLDASGDIDAYLLTPFDVVAAPEPATIGIMLVLGALHRRRSSLPRISAAE